jgi:hypothetical protein
VRAGLAGAAAREDCHRQKGNSRFLQQAALRW